MHFTKLDDSPMFRKQVRKQCSCFVVCGVFFPWIFQLKYLDLNSSIVKFIYFFFLYFFLALFGCSERKSNGIRVLNCFRASEIKIFHSVEYCTQYGFVGFG